MPKVQDYYSGPVYCARETDDLYHARAEMLRRGAQKLVVLDDQDRVTGLLSVTDLVDQGALTRTSSPKRIRLRDGSVGDVMTRHPFTLRSGEDARVAAWELARREVSGAPVVDGNDLKGILTVHDLLPLVVNEPEGRRRVMDVMTRDVIRLHRHDTVAHAARALLTTGARGAVVTEAESGVTRVGVLTLESLVFDDAMEPESPRAKRIKSARKRERADYKDARHVDVVHAVVEDAMWEDHPYIRPDAGLRAAANVFLHEDADVIPVVEDEAVVGMLTKKALAGVLGRRVPA